MTGEIVESVKLDEDASSDDSQAAYAETPYRDNSWEIVGDPPKNLDFVPMEMSVLPGQEVFADPMFADYGGIPQGKTEKRWHLPEELAYVSPEDEEQAGPDEQESLIKLREEELEKVQREAYEKGKLEGLEQAVSENLEKYTTMEQGLQQAFIDLKNQFEENLRLVEKNAVALAVQISGKLVGEAVEINPEYILGIMQEALQMAGAAVVECVRISPQDLEFIEVVGVDKALRDGEATWKFVADESIKAGCVVETSAGEIDYQLDQAWERIKDKVVRILK